MKIFLMRHGEVLSPSEFRQDDHLRPLTANGKKDIESSVELIVKNIENVEILISSPFLRARQTMDVIRKNLGHRPEYMELDMITPNNTEYKHLLGYLKSLGVKSVLYTGHEPQIAGFIQYLVSDHEEIDLQVGTGSLHCVDFSDSEYVSPGTGKLLLSVPQSFLKAS